MKKLIEFIADEKEMNRRVEELSKELGIKMSFTGYINYLVNTDLKKNNN